MSSLVLWSCPRTGVTASWNKEGPYTVFVPSHTDPQGVRHGATTKHKTEKAAVAAAQRKAGALAPVVHVATLETSRFSFRAVSLVSAAEAKRLLVEGCRHHADQWRIAADWFLAYEDAINVDSMPAESVMRDHSTIYVNPHA